MKPKKPTRLTKCVTCKDKLADKKCISCQLCVEWVCLPCSDISEALHDFCQENDETMAFLCKDCKLEIPSLRDMKDIKIQQQNIQTQITEINGTVAETNTTVKLTQETQNLQGEEIKDIIERLNKVESIVNNTDVQEDTESGERSWATIARRNTPNHQIKSIVRSEISEQAEIEKIRMNLVMSGIAETQNEEADKTAALDLIQSELNITADIQKVERLGRPRIQKEGEDPPAPRLLKLFFVTMRSRKEVLSKVTDLRKSRDEHIKKFVYIRPDLTTAQLKESKNLRDLLKTTRQNNRDKVYKIQKNQIVEITQQPQAEPATQPRTEPATHTDTETPAEI